MSLEDSRTSECHRKPTENTYFSGSTFWDSENLHVHFKTWFTFEHVANFGWVLFSANTAFEQKILDQNLCICSV